jgi:hypothetical protein
MIVSLLGDHTRLQQPLLNYQLVIITPLPNDILTGVMIFISVFRFGRFEIVYFLMDMDFSYEIIHII